MALESITASQEGGKRRRAEYVILRLMRNQKKWELEELESGVQAIHQHLLENDFESPFYYRGGGSNGPMSREFDSSIDRLLQFGRVKPGEGGKYTLTESGDDYLEDHQKLERHRIDSEFQDAVDRFVEAL